MVPTHASNNDIVKPIIINLKSKKYLIDLTMYLGLQKSVICWYLLSNELGTVYTWALYSRQVSFEASNKAFSPENYLASNFLQKYQFSFYIKQFVYIIQIICQK